MRPLRCTDSNIIPNFLNFHFSSQSLKASLTYKEYQLKLLQEEICHKKSDIRASKKEFNYSHSSLEHEISFEINRKKKLSKLVKFSTSKVTLNISKYELSDCEKGFLRKV